MQGCICGTFCKAQLHGRSPIDGAQLRSDPCTSFYTVNQTAVMTFIKSMQILYLTSTWHMQVAKDITSDHTSGCQDPSTSNGMMSGLKKTSQQRSKYSVATLQYQRATLRDISRPSPYNHAKPKIRVLQRDILPSPQVPTFKIYNHGRLPHSVWETSHQEHALA